MKRPRTCIFLAAVLLPGALVNAEDDLVLNIFEPVGGPAIVNPILLTDAPVPLTFDAIGEPASLVTPASCTDCSCGRIGCNGCRSCDRGWVGQLEAGLNGAEGNARNLNLVVGFDAKRVSGRNTWTMDIDYLFSRDENEVTKNRLYSLGRLIRDRPNSEWDLFAESWFEFDELEDFRSRIGLHVGFIRTIAETDCCLLRGLVGLGASKELEGADTRWRPEGFLGVLWDRTISSRQKLYLRAVLFPDVGEAGDFRMQARGGWEYALNQEKNVKLSLSAFDRFDSAATGGDRRNNIDYWASLLWGF